MIRLEHITKRFGQRGESLTVFKDLTLQIRANSITAVLGHSGCGKTTLLRMIAGLEKPTSGSIDFSDADKQIGMVFQEYTAFPWRTVAGNVAFGLAAGPEPPNEQGQGTQYWLQATGLTQFAKYYPSQLSGGMKQRLAIARCLAARPSILLLDEPFGSLDAMTREKMVLFSEELLRRLNLTAILVTHSVGDALRLADRAVLLSRSAESSEVLLDVEIPFAHPRSHDSLWSAQSRELELQIRTALRL